MKQLIVDGDKVAASYRMTFTDYDRPMEIEGVMIMTIKDDLIAIRKDYWDGLSHLRQTVPGLESVLVVTGSRR